MLGSIHLGPLRPPILMFIKGGGKFEMPHTTGIFSQIELVFWPSDRLNLTVWS